MKKTISLLLVCILALTAFPLSLKAQSTYSATPNSAAWAKAYYDYVVKDYNSWYGEEPEYQLVYIDNDSVPELFIDYLVTADGCKLLTYNGSKVQAYEFGMGGLQYEAFQGQFNYYDGHMDYYHDTIYKLTNGKVTKIVGGENVREYPSTKIIYYWNGKKTTKANYNANINKYVNLDICKTTYNSDSTTYSYNELKSYLSQFIKAETTSTLQDWAKAYSDFIVQDKSSDSYDWEYRTYQLIYLDSDNIPELFLKYSYNAKGALILSYKDGLFEANQVALDDILYEEYKNTFMQVRELKGYHMDLIYKLKDCKLVDTGTGSYALGTTNYKWNDKSVSKKVYEQNIKNLIDTSRAKSTYNVQEYDYYDILDKLSTYTGGTKKEISCTLSSSILSYNGNKRTPTVIVKDSTGRTLKNGTDYRLEYSNKKRTKVGKYMIRVVPKINYVGEKTLYYTIVPKKTSELSGIRYQYGNKIRLSWKKVTGATGYRISWKAPGETTYSFLANTKYLYFVKGDLPINKSYTFKVTPYYTANGVKRYSTSDAAYRTVVVSTVKKGTELKKISKPVVKKSGTKVKVSWKNVSGETGYQISKSTSSTGTNIVSTYKTTKGTYKTLSATKNKTYYYKVRAYRVVNDKKIYGPWSSVVSYKRK